MRSCIFILALSSLMLLACKPTPRTARKDTHTTPPAEADAHAQAEVSAPAPPKNPAPAGLLDITSTRQDYNRLRPWEKGNTNTGHFKGVYIGSGRVLTIGRAARAATYVELSLPDHSRTVPAKVLKFDNELDLALLTVVHPEDASIFDSLTAHTIGASLTTGDKAELNTTNQNLAPIRVGVEVESVDEEERLPRLALRSEKPLPTDMGSGLPILKDGRLVAIVDDYDTSEQALDCINAEFIERFMDESTDDGKGVPVLGIKFAQLDDPAFSKYLKLSPEQGGIYVSETLPGGSAQAAGILAGDVITSIEGLPLDKLGRCKHPLYGLLSAQHVITSLKPVGQQLKLGISRNGVEQEITVPLNRDAVDKSLMRIEQPGIAPRYIVWGGLVFQPFTETYMNALRNASNNLPLPLLSAKERLTELQAEGRTELVALTQVIPTPATLSYDALGFCLVEKVNGKIVHSFAELAELLDTPTADGIVELTLNRPPYTIYLDQKTVDSCNDLIRRRAIPRLRQLGESETK